MTRVAATLLFKHRSALQDGSAGFDGRWELLQRALAGGGVGGRLDLMGLLRVALASEHRYSKRWLLQRAWRLMRESRLADGSAWLLKEPNLQVFADRIVASRPDVRLLVIVRNGLETAYRGNQQEALVWGAGVGTPGSNLEHWCASHERLLKVGECHPQRVGFNAFNDLCFQSSAPIRTIGRILGLADWMSRIFKAPKSIGRHETKDLSELPTGLVESSEMIMARVSDDS